MSEQNLWGDLPVIKDQKTPFQVLREQAGILTKLCRGLLEGRAMQSEQTDPRYFVYRLSIVAPSLNGYTLSVLWVRHGITLYPIAMGDEIAGKQYNAQSEAEFIALLGQILSSPSTKKVLESLLLQAQATKNP
jgi:hypothetical protein